SGAAKAWWRGGRPTIEAEASSHVETGGSMVTPNLSSKELRRVVIAAAAGNVIEWYDFYIFGSLASILSVKFFEKSHPVAALLSTVALFSIGFLIRPLGAFLFGRIGDLVRRKCTCLITVSGIVMSTARMGYVRSHGSVGLTATAIMLLRPLA